MSRNDLVEVDLREIGEFNGVVAEWDRITLVELAGEGSGRCHAGRRNTRYLKT